MTPLAIVGYVLILVIIGWVIMSSIFVGVSSFGPYEGGVLKSMAIFALVIVGIVGISAVNSLLIKR
jgi:hypothetical protein